MPPVFTAGLFSWGKDAICYICSNARQVKKTFYQNKDNCSSNIGIGHIYSHAYCGSS